MDVYRLDSTEDFLNLGVEELLYGDGVCVVEWSEKVMEVLPKETIIIRLEAEDTGFRHITIDNWPYGALHPRITSYNVCYTKLLRFTKNQILAQAGNAMIAQANSQPQSVLRLMQ